MKTTLSLEAMSYKQQISKDQSQELITKLRIIKQILNNGHCQTKTAVQFRCHRNTVANIIKRFKNNFSREEQNQLLGKKWKKDQLIEKLQPIRNKSTRPHSNCRQLGRKEEKRLLKIFKEEKVRVGVKMMQLILKRRFADSQDPVEQELANLPLGQIKGVYKRNKLKVKKMRSRNGNVRPLYDYTQLGCFERMHYDVKHVLDMSALPNNIYQLFAANKELPLFQWTVQDAKSRLRFFGYSREINSEFGLKFLLFVIQFIRDTFVTFTKHIKIGTDNGVEFCSGSEKKEQNWNDILELLNASLYSYHPGHDIRKNLIERSHLTDDRYLYMSRGVYMDNLPSYMKEARNYLYYFNFKRPHTGIGMKNRTPAQVLIDSGMLGVKKLLEFPVIVLEDEIKALRQSTDYLLLKSEVNRYRRAKGCFPDLKKLVDLKTKYSFFNNLDAQNVLTQYQRKINYFKRLISS